jgi:zinc protease
MLETMSTYNLPADFISRRQEVTRSMTLDQHRELAQKYVSPQQMYYVVVGDAATQLAPLRSLGLGTPVLAEK